jgi:hypothetical protein
MVSKKGLWAVRRSGLHRRRVTTTQTARAVVIPNAKRRDLLLFASSSKHILELQFLSTNSGSKNCSTVALLEH